MNDEDKKKLLAAAYKRGKAFGKAMEPADLDRIVRCDPAQGNFRKKVRGTDISGTQREDVESYCRADVVELFVDSDVYARYAEKFLEGVRRANLSA